MAVHDVEQHDQTETWFARIQHESIIFVSPLSVVLRFMRFLNNKQGRKRIDSSILRLRFRLTS